MDIKEAGHGKRPMDGLGACIKQTIKDIITYNPGGIISNIEELMQYMPDLSISVYQHIMKMISFPTESYFQTWMIWKL